MRVAALRRARWRALAIASTALVACRVGTDVGNLSGGGQAADGSMPTSGALGTTAGNDGSASPTTATLTSGSATTAPNGPKLDVGSDPAGSADDTASPEGCSKVDFLFVVDNSFSMQGEQDALVASFGGFIATIQSTLVMAQDHHIMVVDTDASPLGFNVTCFQGDCTCVPEPQCCFGLCAAVFDPPVTECGADSCDLYPVPTGCPVILGAGKSEDLMFNPCGIPDDRRYMTDTQPDLVNTFGCVARVGAGGDGNERPMEAMMRAVTNETIAGGCHEGFLRDDAILVVTFITDEEDAGSVGGPNTWLQTVVDAKNGNEEAIVVLGLLSDAGVAGGLCTAFDAPVLREFAASFTHGSWASVCAPSYDSFFADAVSVIDLTCREFDPAG